MFSFDLCLFFAVPLFFFLFFFFNDTATTEIYTLSLHDALPIRSGSERAARARHEHAQRRVCGSAVQPDRKSRRVRRRTLRGLVFRDLAARVNASRKPRRHHRRRFTSCLRSLTSCAWAVEW